MAVVCFRISSRQKILQETAAILGGHLKTTLYYMFVSVGRVEHKMKQDGLCTICIGSFLHWAAHVAQSKCYWDHHIIMYLILTTATTLV
mmetsp:Transcript_507/g.1190  ORF Transcript_507/g.1190 Transcript_507/m.1190 type:complete len:89 (+) Transcript_507:338-604(+)